MQSTQLYGDAEIVFQTFNAGITVFKYESTEESYYWKNNYCQYIAMPHYNFSYRIIGNHHNDDYSLELIHEHELPISKGFFGLTKLKISIYTDDDTTIKKIFYYDVRDCQFYGPCNRNEQDITLRYDNQNNILWFKEGYDEEPTPPSEDNGWEKVSETTSTTKTFWGVDNITHCPLDFSGVAPMKPSNFNVSGSMGEHPILSWQENTEPDITGYKIYVNYDNSGYTLVYTINDRSTTSYTDNGVTITEGRFDPTVCYKISAFDVENYESAKTNEKCVKSSDINKESVYTEDNEIVNYDNYIKIFPNPFNPSTNIEFSLENDSHVNIAVYDVLGREVSNLYNDYLTKGLYSTEFKAVDLNSGIYFVRFIVGKTNLVSKIWFIK